ncbi:MAG: hypothetical protein M0Z58_09270 [Nitrospiraceae bacterium]|nr:hypothetical protein [Nitrospiraceae bacterium]
MEERITSGRLPSRCLDWLVSSRLEFLRDIGRGNPMRFFSAHLPVMTTWPDIVKAAPGEFAVNMTVKGIGLLPRPDLLADYTDIFEGALAESRTRPWTESLSKRIETAARLYSDTGHFDPAALGGLEIFVGKTAMNMRENPRVSLLYSGMRHAAGEMRYISFQVNGVTRVLEKGDPYYRFLLASRKLFEFEKFHLFQADYPFGYMIRIEEVLDKSPFPKYR